MLACVKLIDLENYLSYCVYAGLRKAYLLGNLSEMFTVNDKQYLSLNLPRRVPSVTESNQNVILIRSPQNNFLTTANPGN